MSLQSHLFDSPQTEIVPLIPESSGIREGVRVIVVSGALRASSTSSAEPGRLWEPPFFHESEGTVCGLSWDKGEKLEVTRQAISELRRISGLTWDQLGQVFGVSRRSVHFWASGKPLNASNEQRLMRVLDVIRTADRGHAKAMRAALFDTKDGTTPFEQLVSECFDEARRLLGTGTPPTQPALTELSASAKEFRNPLSPDELVDAQHDRVHRDPGRVRAARTMRKKRRGTS